VEIVLALVIVAVVVWFVSVPLRRSAGDTQAVSERLEDPRVAELEARKEAKYREIRDAELRREAIEILKELDRAGAEAGREHAARSAEHAGD
jgi:hypothetical protein